MGIQGGQKANNRLGIRRLKKKTRTLFLQYSGHKPGNNLLSQSLTLDYHQLLGA